MSDKHSVVSEALRRRFLFAIACYQLGRASVIGMSGEKTDPGPDCSGCADPALRDLLGCTEAQWQELCGPRGLDCPVIAAP